MFLAVKDGQKSQKDFDFNFFRKMLRGSVNCLHRI